MPNPNCLDCKGSGEIKTQSVKLGRPYWKDGKIVCDVSTHGDWYLIQCHCVGEEDYYKEKN